MDVVEVISKKSPLPSNQIHASELSKCSHPPIREIACCSTVGFSRQGYYQYWQRQVQGLNFDDQLLELVKQVRADHPRIGGRKLYLLLKPEMDKRGIKAGRDAFFDLLSTHKQLIRRRRRRIMTTFSRHRFRKYPNLIKEVILLRPNQVWVSDITYWFTGYACLYISLVTDGYSRRIMGYTVAETLEAINCKEALLMAYVGISRKSVSRILEKFKTMHIHKWRIPIDELAAKLSPVIRGVMNYYRIGAAKASVYLWNQLKLRLLKWVRWEKRLPMEAARSWLRKKFRQKPALFPHWKLVYP